MIIFPSKNEAAVELTPFVSTACLGSVSATKVSLFVPTTGVTVVESISTSVAIGGTIGKGPACCSFSRVTLDVDSRRLLLALLLCEDGAEWDEDLRSPEPVFS
uniref:Uncharacterized protein n=1 Tax=Anopheles merus TaxID=30066 RepID=A0A182VKW3_ANOME